MKNLLIITGLTIVFVGIFKMNATLGIILLGIYIISAGYLMEE